MPGYGARKHANSRRAKKLLIRAMMIGAVILTVIGLVVGIGFVVHYIMSNNNPRQTSIGGKGRPNCALPPDKLLDGAAKDGQCPPKQQNAEDTKPKPEIRGNQIVAAAPDDGVSHVSDDGLAQKKPWYQGILSGRKFWDYTVEFRENVADCNAVKSDDAHKEKIKTEFAKKYHLDKDNIDVEISCPAKGRRRLLSEPIDFKVTIKDFTEKSKDISKISQESLKEIFEKALPKLSFKFYQFKHKWTQQEQHLSNFIPKPTVPNFIWSKKKHAFTENNDPKVLWMHTIIMTGELKEGICSETKTTLDRPQFIQAFLSQPEAKQFFGDAAAERAKLDISCYSQIPFMKRLQKMQLQLIIKNSHQAEEMEETKLQRVIKAVAQTIDFECDSIQQERVQEGLNIASHYLNKLKTIEKIEWNSDEELTSILVGGVSFSMGENCQRSKPGGDRRVFCSISPEKEGAHGKLELRFTKKDGKDLKKDSKIEIPKKSGSTTLHFLFANTELRVVKIPKFDAGMTFVNIFLLW